ncbi:universal stress protein [Turicimonas muris]|uniref:Universal stress protein n=4 Tax=Turicimonas muris TaxID=1796652 RepID=A0A227KED1_9BURK|nr:universal stress protein [Turicimonas muris]ANU66447.1 universal stress protein [Burkholderiales bacterium YL45]MBS4767658.1 universal stress protein [Burkholderiales bacterium]MBS4846389.1 universal stress protein [Burkholderiales bacterium]OXE45952.1 universal stress protein [Turicimonas muris]QQQ97597.1 universal stress protein [Turicimonas muris]
MYSKILIPTDGSELSDKALEAGVNFAKALGSSVVIATVIEPYSYSNLSEYRPESIDQYDSRVRELAQERLEGARELVEKKEVPCEVVAFKSFSPAEAIIDAATEYGCDLIFMASHGRQGLAAVLLGSETQKVLTHSKIPVMVYR